jgi:hypothetical protein
VKLTDEVIGRIQELAEGMNFGRITIFLNGDSLVHVAHEHQERFSAHAPAPGVIVAQGERREG